VIQPAVVSACHPHSGWAETERLPVPPPAPIDPEDIASETPHFTGDGSVDVVVDEEVQLAHASALATVIDVRRRGSRLAAFANREYGAIALIGRARSVPSPWRC
jgi:hypothetical protein